MRDRIAISTGFKSTARHVLGAAYAALAGGSLKDALTIFVYHDVSDHPSEFSRSHNLNVPPAIFESQVRSIQQRFTVISPDNLLERNLPPRAALITFDDGFQSYFRQALPILERYRVPSLIFLNMEPVRGGLFWSGLITYLCRKEPRFQDRLLKQSRVKTEKGPLFLSCGRAIVRDYLTEADPSLPEAVRTYVGAFASEQDLRDAASHPLVTFGNHLYNHDVPRLLSDEEFLESFRENRRALQAYPNHRDLFAFPFGHPGTCYAPHQVDLLWKEGVKGVFSSSGGLNHDPQGRCLDRIALDASHDTEGKILAQVFYGTARKKMAFLS